MKFNEYKHWRKPKKKNKDIIPKVIDNLDRIKDSLFNSTDSIAYNNAFAIDTVIKWLSTLTNVNESLRKNTLIKCVKKLDEIYNSLNEAGYNWNKGMSNNAVSAYENGRMPISKWSKNLILEKISEFYPEVLELASKEHIDKLREIFLYKSEYHHTSKYYNVTDFYAFDEELDMNDILDELNQKYYVWDRMTRETLGKDLTYSQAKKLEKSNKYALIDNMQFFGEDFKLMDKEEPEYQLGDAYIVDTKQELIDGLNKIIIGDTIALKQGDREITIYFNDENDYSILDDDGTLDDDLRYDDIGRIHDMTKEDILDWIEVYI